ncbi:hypothetical protein HRbin26_01571 [bacterium HR26]|nr:hypothetical protein HRbin26_01571 [bacterium HR26]
MDIRAVGLVLDEEAGPDDFADVVVEHRDPGQERVAADHLRCRLGEVAHHQAVVVRARRLAGEPGQQRLIGVRQLEELQVRGDPEQPAEQAKGQEAETGRERPVHPGVD